ncbi:MAG: hypothetical protein FWF04_02965, partial [Clostridiales bacterium]|nr:hypothetical protein [Clostridiales bacterium]
EKDGHTLGLLTVKEERIEIPSVLLSATPERDDTENAASVDVLFKEVLEGYTDSYTEDSYRDYKYREQTDQVIYLVKEKTEILFTVEVPDSKNMYTHVNMKNGGYTVLAKVGEIKFDFKPYLDIGYNYVPDSVLTMSPFNLDAIQITVSGSMYDDRQIR